MAICDELRSRGLEEEVRARTGLRIDAYFSATKVRFILDAVKGAQERAERGELCFGTVDSWLLFGLTLGRVHGDRGLQRFADPSLQHLRRRLGRPCCSNSCVFPGPCFPRYAIPSAILATWTPSGSVRRFP